jgi:segregation and condensation protein A
MTSDVADTEVDVSGLGPAEPESEAGVGFAVRLDNFEGPFDLLLSLIAKHKLDITEVALSKVTDEFIAHIRAGGPEWDLEQTTSFLLVASTLLDLKAARLLPQGDVEDEEDLALLEARDLLFARLLQYRAFKQVASVLEQRLADEASRHPRAVGLEERFATLLPEVLIGLGLDEFAALAAKAMEPKPVLELSLAHIHAPTVSVREQAAIVVERLRRQKAMTFRALSGDAPDMLTRVARFLSLLELFREGAVAFDQVSPLGELTVRWTGAEEGEVTITDEFDGSPLEEGEGTTTNGSPPEEEDRGPDDPGDDPDHVAAHVAVDDVVDDVVEDAAANPVEDAVEGAGDSAGAVDGAEMQEREPE